MREIVFLFAFFTIVGCTTDTVEDRNTLASFLKDKVVVYDNVIACAASNLSDGMVSVFYYPRENATNIHYYESQSADQDKNEFSNYLKIESQLQDVFNGYLQKIEVEVPTEKWVIVTFDEGGATHVSNPIRLKHLSKPTEYLPQNINVDASSEMPMFSWDDGVYDDSVIYFQVVSNQEDRLLSGTYTYDKTFTYYDLQNVVLNITQDMPPALEKGSVYTFTLMGVSEDNWVNQFSIIEFNLD